MDCHRLEAQPGLRSEFHSFSGYIERLVLITNNSPNVIISKVKISEGWRNG